MAIGVAQYEEIGELLRQVPRLVDSLEARRPGMVGEVLAWLKQAEGSLENNRLPAVSQMASCRASLIAAARGLQNKDVAFLGRATPRKLLEATASLMLERGNELLHSVIAERQSAFQDAERIARQIMVVAQAKGLVRDCRDAGGPARFLQCLQQKVAADPDLTSAHAHLLAIVGKNDVLVFLDRALEAVA